MSVSTYRMGNRRVGGRFGKLRAADGGSRTLEAGQDYELTGDEVRALEAQGFTVVKRIPLPEPVADDADPSGDESADDEVTDAV